MASTTTWPDDLLDNLTNNDVLVYAGTNDSPVRRGSFILLFSKWILRFICVFIIVICPWANYKLVELFQKRPFYKESSAKWYIIFKAIFDAIYMLISIPILFCLTFDIDIIHKHILPCKFITYVHYLSDDLISILLTLLCIDRMIRITCGYRLRKRFSLTVCIIITCFFMIINVHHIIRLQHQNGICHKVYFGIWDYDFDIYYSFIYTSVLWTIIFITSINLTISIYCDRARRIRLQQQQQQNTNKIFVNGGGALGSDSDRLELIHSIDDWEDATTITIEQNKNLENKSSDIEQQDDTDLKITVCVLITSAIFLACNLPNFIVFILTFVFNASIASIGYVFIYIALFPLLIAHTITYFIFNHLAARLFPNNLS